MISDALASAAPYHVEAADCFDFAARIPDGAVNLLWLDGPYNMGKAEWDTFPSVDAFLAFYDRVLDEARRVLAPNGSLYVCTQPDVGDLLSVRVRSRFSVLNRIRWEKDAGWHKKAAREELRGLLSPWEEIIFAEHPFEWIRAYLDDARRAAGVDFEQVRRAVGCAEGSGLPSHWFTRSQWMLPTREHYATLQELFNAGRPESASRLLPLDYEKLRRHFDAPEGARDLWTYPTVQVSPHKHSCEKPAAMLRDVIAASSRPGDVVCEWFMGSGVGGEQAVLQGRRYLGCDADPEWARRGVARIERALRAPHEAGRPVVTEPVDPRQRVLW